MLDGNCYIPIPNFPAGKSFHSIMQPHHNKTTTPEKINVNYKRIYKQKHWEKSKHSTYDKTFEIKYKVYGY
jgi:hypothetical protein